jgi:hypothetical protein
MSGPHIRIDDSYYDELESILQSIKSRQKFYQMIVDAPFENKLNSTLLGLGFLAFLLVNKEKGTLDRITISDTYSARGAIDMTATAFNDMKVPLNHKGNIVLTAIKTGRYQQTNDWHYLTDPAVTAEDSRFNQAAAGISSSFVYPTNSTKPAGAIIFQYYLPMPEIEKMHHDFMFRYIKLVSKEFNRRQDY